MLPSPGPKIDLCSYVVEQKKSSIIVICLKVPLKHAALYFLLFLPVVLKSRLSFTDLMKERLFVQSA